MGVFWQFPIYRTFSCLLKSTLSLCFLSDFTNFFVNFKRYHLCRSENDCQHITGTLSNIMKPKNNSTFFLSNLPKLGQSGQLGQHLILSGRCGAVSHIYSLEKKISFMGENMNLVYKFSLKIRLGSSGSFWAAPLYFGCPISGNLGSLGSTPFYG